jgi:hypothetical protein
VARLWNLPAAPATTTAQPDDNSVGSGCRSDPHGTIKGDLMRNNVATLAARVGMAALASLGALALSGGTASAAPSQKITAVHSTFAAAPTPEQCSTIPQQIEGLEARVLTLQDQLGEASPTHKPAIIRMIRTLEGQISALEALIAGCPA